MQDVLFIAFCIQRSRHTCVFISIDVSEKIHFLIVCLQNALINISIVIFVFQFFARKTSSCVSMISLPNVRNLGSRIQSVILWSYLYNGTAPQSDKHELNHPLYEKKKQSNYAYLVNKKKPVIIVVKRNLQRSTKQSKKEKRK